MGKFTLGLIKYNGITLTSLLAQWRLKSPASPYIFTQLFIQVQIKENIKAPRHWPLCGTKGQWRRKCFYLMASSWKGLFSVRVTLVYVWKYMFHIPYTFTNAVWKLFKLASQPSQERNITIGSSASHGCWREWLISNTVTYLYQCDWESYFLRLNHYPNIDDLSQNWSNKCIFTYQNFNWSYKNNLQLFVPLY